MHPESSFNCVEFYIAAVRNNFSCKHNFETFFLRMGGDTSHNKICCAPNCPPNIESTALQKSQQRNIVAHHRLTMSTVRLEIIRGILPCFCPFTFPAHMCRNLPEALVGLVGDEAFSTFCDRLDSWLEILDKEHIREIKQCMCSFVTTTCLGYLFIISFALASSPGLWMSSVLCGSPIPFLLVWGYRYRRPDGALTIDEIMYKIRGECADMTRQAPNLYFLVASESPGYVGHIAVSFTLLARLEIIKDKATSVRYMPAHMCRNLPAALEGLVDDEAFRAFCDRLDSWLELLGAEDNRLLKRLGCILYGILFCIILFVVVAAIGFVTSVFWPVSVLCIIIIHVSLVCRFTRRPHGALSSDEILCKIRAECDNMTHHAPNLSFKVFIGCIRVSASLSTQESGVASVPEVILGGVDDTTIKIDNDENEGETDTDVETMSSTSSGDASMELFV
jgi:hypothetical protein